jgi:phosphatidylglycerophosphate synthase
VPHNLRSHVTQSATAIRNSVDPYFKGIPRVLLILTFGRLLFIPIVIVSLVSSPLVTAVALSLFIAADLYDGVAARQLGADDPERRVLDSLVDRAAIWAVYLAATIIGLLPVALFMLMLARDAYCGYVCQQMVRRRNVAIRADWMYRGLNLALAAWIVAAPLVQANVRLGMFAGILAFSAVVAMDLKRSVAAILRMPSSAMSTVIAAGDVRRLHRGLGHGLGGPPVSEPLVRSA